MSYETKDSGERVQLAGGMVRDVTGDKLDWTLLLKGPLLQRWCELLARGAKKYGKHNWTLALKATDRNAREATKERFLESAFRHFMQWARGERDEDHAAAVIFNMNGYEAMLQTDIIARPTPLDEALAKREIERGPVFEPGRVRDEGVKR